MMQGEETQWRVTWFPDGPDRVYAGDEASVRVKYAELEEAGYAPLLEYRTVFATPWAMER